MWRAVDKGKILPRLVLISSLGTLDTFMHTRAFTNTHTHTHTHTSVHTQIHTCPHTHTHTHSLTHTLLQHGYGGRLADTDGSPSGRRASKKAMWGGCTRSTCACVYVSMYMCVCMHGCVYVSMYMCACMHVCMYVCECVYVCMCIYLCA